MAWGFAIVRPTERASSLALASIGIASPGSRSTGERRQRNWSCLRCCAARATSPRRLLGLSVLLPVAPASEAHAQTLLAPHTGIAPRLARFLPHLARAASGAGSAEARAEAITALRTRGGIAIGVGDCGGRWALIRREFARAPHCGSGNQDEEKRQNPHAVPRPSSRWRRQATQRRGAAIHCIVARGWFALVNQVAGIRCVLHVFRSCDT